MRLLVAMVFLRTPHVASRVIDEEGMTMGRWH
jgi:hypothetical protein